MAEKDKLGGGSLALGGSPKDASKLPSKQSPGGSVGGGELKGQTGGSVKVVDASVSTKPLKVLRAGHD